MPEPWRPTGNFKCTRGFFGELFISIEESQGTYRTHFPGGAPVPPADQYPKTRWRTAKYKDLPAIQRAMVVQDRSMEFLEPDEWRASWLRMVNNFRVSIGLKPVDDPGHAAIKEWVARQENPQGKTN